MKDETEANEAWTLRWRGRGQITLRSRLIQETHSLANDSCLLASVGRPEQKKEGGKQKRKEKKKSVRYEGRGRGRNAEQSHVTARLVWFLAPACWLSVLLVGFIVRLGREGTARAAANSGRRAGGLWLAGRRANHAD